MPIHRIRKNALVSRVYIKDGDAVAPAAIVAERTSILVST